MRRPPNRRRRALRSTRSCRGSEARTWGVAANAIELLEDLDRLAAKLGILPVPVLLRELALLAVELGVADLAVLDLLARLELGDRGVLGPRHGRLDLVLGAAKRRGHEPDDHRDDHERKHDLHGATG